MNSAPSRLVALLLISAVGLIGCGPEGGTGPFGSYDARIALRSENVAESRESVRTIIERNHGGNLAGEVTDADSGPFDFKELSVLTFRVPALQIDAAIGEIDGGGVGKITKRERGQADDSNTSSDLKKVSDTINEQIKDLTSSPEVQLQNAQKKLKELADRSSMPVLVVEINPEPSLFDYGWAFTTNRLVWVLLAVGLASRIVGASKGKVIANLHKEKTKQENNVKEISKLVAKKVVEEVEKILKPEDGAQPAAAGPNPKPGGRRAYDPPAPDPEAPKEPPKDRPESDAKTEPVDAVFDEAEDYPADD